MRQLLIDLFVDRHARDDVDAVDRTLRIVMLALSVAVWVPVFAPLYVWLEADRSALVVVVSGLLCLLLLFALRWGVPHGVIIQLLIALLYSTIAVLALLTGGITAPVLYWLCAVPIYAVLLGGYATGIVWLVLALAMAGVLLALDRSGVVFLDEVTESGQLWLHVASLWGIISCAMLLTVIFRRSERAARANMERARQMAEQANRAKSDFLAKMTHEIRTPMNGVIGMSQLALSTQLTPMQRDCIEAAKESAEALLVVVNDILEFAQMEAGRLELRVQAFRIRDLLRRTMTLLAVRADPDKLKVTWRAEPDVPEVVIADMGRLRQVLINLAGNAIKFTPAGDVTVRVSLAQDDDRPGVSPVLDAAPDAAEGSAEQLDHKTATLLFEVRDTGVGIPEEQQARIFKEFEQADEETSRMFGGTGLGLSITRGLVTMMGGRIELESREGVGSTFRVSVPVGIGTDADLVLDDSSCVALAGAELEDVQGLRVLVVDDNLTNQVLIRGLLLRHGCEVTIAERGETALERMAAGEFDLILMDIEMPGMNGFDTARQIRQQETNRARTPIFALTARAGSECEPQCRDVGMDGYLEKPLQMPEVLAILQQVALARDNDGQGQVGGD